MTQSIEAVHPKIQPNTDKKNSSLESPFRSHVNLLGLDTHDQVSLSKEVLEGFSFETFVRLQEAIMLSTEELANLVHLSLRTLTRRKDKGQLRTIESERILRISRLFSLAVELFEGDKQSARNWLVIPIKALNGMTPLELARTEVGAREVESLIGRLEYGVFS